jgi:hypothetical protein
MYLIKVFIIIPIYDIYVEFHIIINIITIRADVIIVMKIIMNFFFNVRSVMI